MQEIYKLIPLSMASYPSDTAKFRLQLIPMIPHPNNASAGRVYAGSTDRPAYGTMPAQSKCATQPLSQKQGEALAGKTSGMLVLRAEYDYAPMFANTLGFGAATWKMETLIGPRYGCHKLWQ